jgi:hypothetical protein
MPANVNSPRAADQLRREYNVIGDRINLRLDDVVVPVAIISDLTAGSGGVPVVRRAYAAFYQAAVAAEYTTWRFEIPSGFIAIINRLIVEGPAADLLRVHFGTTIAAPANIANEQYIDGRLRQRGLFPAGTLAYGTQAGAHAGPYDFLQGGAAPGIETFVEWPVGRDDGLIDFVEFQWPIVNNAVMFSMQWDEVPLV